MLSGILLFISTVIALLWANSPFADSYHALSHLEFLGMSLHLWINDALMAIFFFVVGLEIKRELVEGALSSREKASLPIAAAVGGMLFPALIYFEFNQGLPSVSGWGISMATDIAFALGVLSILGERVPRSLRVFLTALAIVDDMGAVLVIALFYTASISLQALGLGLGIFALLYAFNRMGLKNAAIYLIFGALAWFAFLKSGVHATIAGVILALVVPMELGKTLEVKLHHFVGLAIMPVFALSNAGVALAGGSLTHPISLGIIFGLFFGKQIGVTFFAWLSVKLKLASLPEGAKWGGVYGVSLLAGIGFTMSLFIGGLAFKSNEDLDLAKVSILVASIISGILGTFVLVLNSRVKQTD